MIDEIMDVRRDHALDVMLLSETWHDGDSVSIRRLRAEVSAGARARSSACAARVTSCRPWSRRHRSSARCAYVCCVASQRTANRK